MKPTKVELKAIQATEAVLRNHEIVMEFLGDRWPGIVEKVRDFLRAEIDQKRADNPLAAALSVQKRFRMPAGANETLLAVAVEMMIQEKAKELER